MPRVSPLLLLPWALACTACTGEPRTLQDKAMSPVTSFLGDVPLPEGPVAGHPWADRPCRLGQPEAAVLACVDGAAITRQRFDAVRADYPPDTPVRAIVGALIDEELLARAAAPTLWGPWLQPTLRRLMVGRMLKQQMEQQFDASQITEADVQAAWANKTVRQHYDRPGVYIVTDAQLICCTGDRAQCAKSPDAMACINALAPTATELAAFLRENPPHSAVEMRGRVGADPRFAKAAVVEVSFFYEPDKPHEEQKGYTLMVKPFVDMALSLHPGELAATPVRSEFGWHVMRLESAVPPAHPALSDPKVQADLRQNLVPALRDDRVDALSGELAKASGVQLFLGRFDEE